MVSIPLAYASYERQTSLLPEVVCRNLFVEKDDSDPQATQLIRIQRPGLSPYRTLPDTVRGLFYSESVTDNRIYAVSGSSLVALDISAQGYTVIGNVGTDGLAATFAPSFDKFAITSAGDLYTYYSPVGQPAVLGKIAMPDDREVVSVTELNSFIIIGCPDGRFFWMFPGQNTVDPLNFATAESSTDGLISVKSVGDEIYFYGTSSTEIWSATGDDDLPFIRSQGRNFTKGLLDRDTVVVLDNAPFWVANNGVVYRAGAVPERVSNHGIEERISRREGILSALTATVDAHEFYVLKIPGQGSFAYDAATKQWSEFATYQEETWRPTFAVAIGTDNYLADYASGKVWLFDHDAVTDDGLPIERVVTGTIPLPPRPVANPSIRLDVGSSIPCVYQVRWKDAQTDWVPYKALKARAGNDRIALYRLGQARGQYRTFEIRVIEPSVIRIGSADANDAWRR